jgi:cation diffusion facilitator family transporter
MDMDINFFKHEHHFNQHRPKAGERRTLWVIILTASMMIGEIIAGILFGSMALLADGLHMASHATALSISALAYVYARRNAHNEQFSFGTGKISSLAGFTSALLLALFALFMAWESINRFLHPVSIAFNEAILVAMIGLFVNIVSVFILNVKDKQDNLANHAHQRDHNLSAAYLHVLADALTSLLAIIALLAGKYFGLNWMDPFMGIIGAALVTHWSYGLLRDTSQVLLDIQAPAVLRNAVREAIESDGQTRVTDLHMWSIGSSQYAVIIGLVSRNTVDLDKCRARLASFNQIAHITIEIQKFSEC